MRKCRRKCWLKASLILGCRFDVFSHEGQIDNYCEKNMHKCLFLQKTLITNLQKAFKTSENPSQEAYSQLLLFATIKFFFSYRAIKALKVQKFFGFWIEITLILQLLGSQSMHVVIWHFVINLNKTLNISKGTLPMKSCIIWPFD